MKKLLLGCILSIGFSKQLTAHIEVLREVSSTIRMMSDLLLLNQDLPSLGQLDANIEQMLQQEQVRQQEREQMEKNYYLSLCKMMDKWRKVDKADAQYFNMAAQRMCDNQIRKQNKIFQQSQQELRKNRYTSNRE